MENRVLNMKTPAPGLASDAGECVQESPGGPAVERRPLTPPPTPNSRVDISRELDALHEELSHLAFEDALRAKIEDSFMEARVACCLAQPDRAAVGEALNRALKTARRADEFNDVVSALRPHVERSVAWLGREWQRILAVV